MYRTVRNIVCCLFSLGIIITSPTVLHITGQTNVPDVGLEQSFPVRISYLVGDNKPAQWEITVPDEVELADVVDYVLLIPMCLPPLQFVIADNGTFFNGTFYSTSTITSGSTSFTLNINGSGLVMDGGSVNVTFDAIANGNLDLSTYNYSLSARNFLFDVNEDVSGRVTLSTESDIDTSLDVHVVFEYDRIDNVERTFDDRQFRINQSEIGVVGNNTIMFTASGLLGPKPPPQTLCAIGSFSTPEISVSSVKAVQEVTSDEDHHPILWEINIPNDNDLNEYYRTLPLLMVPVSLAFSSNVLDVIGDTFTLNTTLTTNRRTLALMFTSMGLVDQGDNVQILNFSAHATGQLRNSYVRGPENASIIMDFRENPTGNLFAVGNIGNFRMRLNQKYDNKTENPRFTNVELRINHSLLNTVNSTMRFYISIQLVGWNSSCPVGSGGFRCYNCLDGYFGTPINNIPCQRCKCNGHSNKCNQRSGRCDDCEDHTSGKFCQNCADGFYGNATNGGTCYRK